MLGSSLILSIIPSMLAIAAPRLCPVTSTFFAPVDLSPACTASRTASAVRSCASTNPSCIFTPSAKQSTWRVSPAMRLITKRSTRRTGSVRKGRCIRIDLDDLEVIEDRQQLVRVHALMSNNDLVLFAIVRDVEARRRRAVATRREDGHISERVALFAARQVLHAFSRAVNRSREERRSYELRADVRL